MSKFDELYRLHRLLDGRRTGISRAELIGAHGFARATLARFTADELLALVTLKHLLDKLEPGLLDDHLRPLQARIDQLLASRHLGSGEAERIRLLSTAWPQRAP